MTIEFQVGAQSRHRCTDCGEKWRPKGNTTRWDPCTNPKGHACPKCSAPKPADPNCHECKTGAVLRRTKSTWWIYDHATAITANEYTLGPYCPRCGKRLPEMEG